MSEIKYVWKSIRVPETDYDGCYNCVHTHDSEDVCRVRGCVHAIGQIKDYYKRATKTHDKRTKTHACVSPCDVCRYYPPSSVDGKPCSMCPAEPAEPTEQVRTYTSLADCVSRQAAIKETWREPRYTDPLNVLTEIRDRLRNLPSAEPEDAVMLDKEAILQAGYKNREVEFRIGGRLFRVREVAQ